MSGSVARGTRSGNGRGASRGELLALGALATAIVALIAVSIASLDKPAAITAADDQELPVRVVATSGG